ncbi:3-oxo-tetronate kinase [Ahrensia sp. R2A130]|uniref:3-oxo-tetronate kinase n=1 Tax=Ahrensia sp. R2A130 TaxID=744979 RepID=UPI0001E0ACF4|nr:3-oxo-tetronate kinase [Ahrensia sp. R2A130]EFL87751.1 YgbK domain-containing protein [Ahrensia sp. R2A130]
MLIGCIGDDFTGSSDLANTLSKAGMRTVQYTGVPDGPADVEAAAGVVALKTRSIAPADAVEQSLAALRWLLDQGCQQIVFKYCSTFDSTAEGNIGPVADALAEALEAARVIVCPAFPGTGRSIYQGHLFVGDKLLSESGMENHPLTPMTDSDLRRWMALQSKHSVGHVSAADVWAGSEAVKAALDREHDAGHRHIVVDAVRDEDLLEIGRAAKGLPLVTGGSGVAMGLPANFDEFEAVDVRSAWTRQAGRALAVSGSCSNATRAQVALHAEAAPAMMVDAADVIEGKVSAQSALDWALAADGLPLVYSSADPAVVRDIQERYGRERAAGAVEEFFAELVRLAVAAGFTRIITAGGETSGAVVEGLALNTLEIGPEIDPGVPALRAGPGLVVALKSGNFGAPDFFAKADALLSGTPR